MAPELLAEENQSPPTYIVFVTMDFYYIASPTHPSSLPLFIYLFITVHVFYCYYYMVKMLDLQEKTTATYLLLLMSRLSYSEVYVCFLSLR